MSWAAIGARTTESQVRRQLASGLSMPVGFKNGTSGEVQIAVNAIRAAANPHSFFGVTDRGLAGIVATRGNVDCHIILRGGNDAPNYDAGSIQQVLHLLSEASLPPRVVIDASHGNSGKDHRRQPIVLPEVGQRVAAGERGIMGVMLETSLVEGRQDLTDPRRLRYGQSSTDACIGWDRTERALEDLAAAVRARRATGA